MKKRFLSFFGIIMAGVSRIYTTIAKPRIGYAPVDIEPPLPIIIRCLMIVIFPVVIFWEGIIFFSKKKTKKQKIKETLFIWSLFILASCVIQYLMHQETMVVAD